MENETGASSVPVDHRTTTDSTASSSSPAMVEPSPGGPASTGMGTPKVLEETQGDMLERSSSISEDYLRYLSNPHHTEKRFPVDRKKLERLIIAGGKDNESAEDYFKRIMEETGTLVLWPSRLKIGAKSKKDPQVKVVGPPASVQRARELVLNDLDAKSNRVTLKIDVPFAEHSHVIGKEGAHIRKVRDETKCHIHFPDNRSPQERSNQCSITGSVTDVETARRRIRGLLPVSVTFTLPMPGQIDTNSPDLQQMNLTYNVSIHVKPQPRNHCMMVAIRGTVQYIDGLKLAIAKVIEYFTGDYRYVPPVNLGLDIAAQHHRTLIGGGGGNIRKIMQETGTTIQFPDPQSWYHTNQVMVTGTVDCVLQAREQLLGCLPVVLMFDVYESDEKSLSSSLIGELMEQLDVFISVKAKPRQPIQSVIIKSIEQNMQCMYQARLRIMECSSQPIKMQGAVTVETTEKTMRDELQRERSLSKSFPPISEDPLNLSSTAEGLRKALPAQRTVVEKRRVSWRNAVEPTQTSRGDSKSDVAVEMGGSAGDEGDGGEAGERKVREEKTERPPREVSPVEAVPRSSSFTSSHNTPVRLTTRSFLDYEQRREEAQKAMKTKVEPNEKRYPTTKWAGNYFSESMPAGGKEPVQSPTSPSAMPQGLSSINRTGFQALVRQASIERVKTLHADQDLYRGVTDLTTLLQRLGLEKYLTCFEEEEVDFETFQTMTEHDLKEIGISTLGARRKLQIAISELKKLQGNQSAGNGPSAGGLGASGGGVRGRGRRSPYQSFSPQPPLIGLNKSGSLKRSGNFMSNSVRF